MFSKKPSFEESPLQDLSEDQMTQVSGGSDCSSSDSWSWKHRHHHHHRHHRRNTRPVTVEVIIVQNGRKSSSWNSSDSNGYSGGSHW